MNLAETLQLLDKLNYVGAKHFKSADFEVDMTLPEPSKRLSTVTQSTTQPISEPMEQPSEPKFTPTQAQENTRKAQELIDLLKRKDEEILNTIFPEGA